MDSDRWKQVDNLLQAALERPPRERDQFLRQACAGDQELEREVRSLLASQQEAGSFLESPAIEVAVQAKDPDATESIISPVARIISHYRILDKLGSGGMGVVWKARDTRLDRFVALKFLPGAKMSDPDRKRRFIQEARAASALNHPNIVTIYEIDQSEGADFIAMECVPGNSLDKLIAPKGLPIAEVLSYAVQIAGALAAAHAAGIVHRDIKPANAIVNAEGQVKVLDFGLAKLEERSLGPESDTRTLSPTLTETGMVMGTAAYMSPEQARGEEVDARTDLFSLGAVIYEMAAGRRAFLKALDWAAPPTSPLPAELRRIVLKLLEVDRDRRYKTAVDVAADLKSLQRSSENKQISRLWWIAAVVAAFAIIAVLYLRPDRPPGRDKWVRMTNFPDSVSQPALSPDGRMLTFVRGPETFIGAGQIYVKMLPGGEPVQLTHDDLPKMSPVFSPDGSRIAYTSGMWNTWVVPVVSGRPRPWLSNATGLVWLDEKRLLFSEIKGKELQMGLVTSEENHAGKRDVYLPKSVFGMAHRSYPSPDSKSSLVVEMESGAWLPCRLVPLGTASPGHSVGPPGGRCTFAGWSPDGNWMYLSSSSADGSYHTWRQRYPDGQPEQITSGPTEEEGFALFPDGRSFVTSVAFKQSVVLVHDASGDRQISMEGYSYDPKFTPDGKQLCYRILKSGLTTYDPGELHVVELDTGHHEPLLPGLTISGTPGLAYQISPDGRQVVAAAKDRDGKSRLWLAALDRQSAPRQIPGVEGDYPLFGQGAEVFFRKLDGASYYAYRVLADGTGLRRLSEQAIYLSLGVSQDGRWVVVSVPSAKIGAVIALPVKGGLPVPIISSTGNVNDHMSWSPDGGLLFISAPNAASASHVVGRTYVIPLSLGQMFPTIPPGGFHSESELAKIPGVRIIEAFDGAPGPTPEVYAFSRATVQRNLYRIPIP